MAKGDYDTETGKNTIDMRRYLHGGEPRMNAALAAELDRRDEIIAREFERNRRTVLARLYVKGWCQVSGSWRNVICHPHDGPTSSELLMVSPREELVLVHIDELVHNSGEVKLWTERIPSCPGM